MYLAQFADEKETFATAALQWSAPADGALPAAWRRHLLAVRGVDCAIRLSFAPNPRVTLLLSAATDSETKLRELLEKLFAESAPPDLVVPRQASEFDLLTAAPLPHIHADHGGYHHAGKPLACDFRLYRMLSNNPPPGSHYQVGLRAYATTAETERRVLKQLAYLELERPFTEPVRKMQSILLQRLRQPGFLSDEFLFASDSEALEAWTARTSEHFEQTTGRIGFRDMPLTKGDFGDWITTGRLTLDDGGSPVDTATLSAAMMSADEATWLAGFDLTRADAHAATSHGRGADVFISYASPDFAHATAACRDLEEHGIVCWIAPRDIDRDILPYTEAITHAIAQVRAVLVLVSETANLSVHIPRELDLALERKLPIVPMRLADVRPARQLNYLLRTCQWLNAYGRDTSSSLEELRQRLRSVLK
jgi:hypothetical protein